MLGVAHFEVLAMRGSRWTRRARELADTAGPEHEFEAVPVEVSGDGPTEVRTRDEETVAVWRAGITPAPDLPDDEAIQEADDLRLSDVGNARRLVDRHGRDLHYVPHWKAWLVWDGTRWCTDSGGVVDRCAADTTAAMFLEAISHHDRARRDALLRHAQRSESDIRIRAMVSRAAHEAGVPIEAAALDADPWLMCCPNGTLDLRTGALREHRREDLITRRVHVAYRPEAPCTRWETFLDEVFNGDRATIAFVQRAVGYSLTGDTREQCLFFLHGSGANGKTTLVNALRDVLGDYACHTPTETLLVRHRRTVPNDVARLRGARLVSAVEAERGTRLAEVLVKQMTGGDVVCARFLNREWFEFRPTFKVWLTANHKPTIRGTDNAIWRRIHLVPFEVTLPRHRQDRLLALKLHAERAGVLAWAMRGCAAWQREGLAAPGSVRSATQAYREEMDELAGFLGDRCVHVRNVRTPAGALYDAYTEWCQQNGEQVMSQTRFGLSLRERGHLRVRTERARCWVGIRLRQTDMLTPADA